MKRIAAVPCPATRLLVQYAERARALLPILEATAHWAAGPLAGTGGLRGANLHGLKAGVIGFTK